MLCAALSLTLCAFAAPARALSPAPWQTPQNNPEDEDLTTPRPEPSSGGTAAKPAKAAPPKTGGKPGSGGSGAPDDSASGPLSGTASWDAEIVKEFCKKNYHIDLADEVRSFPGLAMLDKVNPEFATRIKTLMRIYQAAGGSTIGIVPRSGGLRSAEDQLNDFTKGRSLKTGGFDVPAGNGSHGEDWYYDKTADHSKDLYADFTDTKTKKTTHALVRRAGEFLGKDKDHNKIYGKVTDVWIGWHNFGVAVDFGEFLAGKYDPNLPLGATMAGAWGRAMIEATGDLGLGWGGWWDDSLNDPAHVEWHPRLHDVKHTSKPGHALRDDQIDASYRWRIPETIYVWTGADGGMKPQNLQVLHLVRDGQWIALDRERRIVGRQDGDWTGTWTRYDPPVHLFPTYLPVRRLSRDLGDADIGFRIKSNVTRETFSLGHDSDGKIVKQHVQSSGTAHLCPNLRITNWELESFGIMVRTKPRTKLPSADLKKSNPQFYQQLSDACAQEAAIHAQGLLKYGRLIDRSVYELELQLAPINGGEASKSTVTTKGQRVDGDGTTDEYESQVETWIGGVNLRLAWDRDKGKVGFAVGPDPGSSTGAAAKGKPDAPGVYDLRDRNIWNDGTYTIVSDKLPHDAWDVQSPPPRDPVNHKK